MDRARLERLAPLSGVLFFALIVAAFVVFPDETPDTGDSRAEVVKFWREHDSEAVASAFLFGLSALPLLWFAGSLRNVCRKVEAGTGRLSSIAFGGAVVLVAGTAIGANLQFIVGDIADDASPDTLHAVGAIVDGFFFPYVIGAGAWLLATAVVIQRFRAMHPAFGWVALLIGLISVTPLGFFGFLGTIFWVLAASIALYMHGDGTPAQPAAPPPPPAA